MATSMSRSYMPNDSVFNVIPGNQGSPITFYSLVTRALESRNHILPVEWIMFSVSRRLAKTRSSSKQSCQIPVNKTGNLGEREVLDCIGLWCHIKCSTGLHGRVSQRTGLFSERKWKIKYPNGRTVTNCRIAAVWKPTAEICLHKDWMETLDMLTFINGSSRPFRAQASYSVP
jgi:hypothetical protein